MSERARAIRRGAGWTAALQGLTIITWSQFASDGLFPGWVGVIIATAVLQWVLAAPVLLVLCIRRAWWMLAGILLALVAFTALGALLALAVPNV